VRTDGRRSTLVLDPDEWEWGEESLGGKESAEGETGDLGLVLELQETLRGSLDRHLQTCGSMSSFSPGKLRNSSGENCLSVLVLD
jgi:hypothetical protein